MPLVFPEDVGRPCVAAYADMLAAWASTTSTTPAPASSPAGSGSGSPRPGPWPAGQPRPASWSCAPILVWRPVRAYPSSRGQRTTADQRNIGLIRTRLQEEAVKFRQGDYAELPDGARITCSSTESGLVSALHGWFDRQTADHGH